MGYDNPLHGDDEAMTRSDNDTVAGLKARIDHEAKPEKITLNIDERARYDRARETARRELADVFADVPRKQEPATELDREQSLRMLAVQMSAKVLAGKPTLFAPGKSPLVADIVTLAEYVLDGLEGLDMPQQVATAEESDRERAHRQGVDLDPRENALLGMIADKAGIPNERVLPEDLRVGDQIAGDGDRLTTKPEFDPSIRRWTARVHCPKDEDGVDFVIRIPDGEPIAVFSRNPE